MPWGQSPRSLVVSLGIDDDDQNLPFEVGGQRNAEMISGAAAKSPPRRAPAVPDTDRDRPQAPPYRPLDQPHT